MTWDRSGDKFQFSCDTGDCMESLTVTAADFVEASKKASVHKWISLKRVGHPWTYHCPGHTAAAEITHRQHIQEDQERERIKARNAS